MMTQENREILQRAVGIVEGVSFVLDKAEQEALAIALELIDKVLESETIPTQGFVPKERTV